MGQCVDLGGHANRYGGVRALRQLRGPGTVTPMPLRCLDEHGASLHAFALTRCDWDALAATNRAARTLTMPCCGARVSLKRSALGLQFFAHLGRGACMTGDESPEHLALKQIAVDAARAGGWHAETEVAAADGSWRADVLATRGRHRVAIEIQWSPQTDEETLRRQAQYAAAGVRALWLFRQRGFPASQDVPAVRVTGNLAKGFTALDVRAATLLEAVFDGRFKFGIPAKAAARVRVMGTTAACWDRDCGALNRIVSRIEIAFGDNRCCFELADVDAGSDLLAAVLDKLPRDLQRGAIKRRFSHTMQSSYVSNGCWCCDRLFGRFFQPGDPYSETQLVGFQLVVSLDLAALIEGTAEFDPAWTIVPVDVPPRVAPRRGVG